ncbi:MAG: hypothetical protein R2911_24205 [Caldilineaceae bacterium]
MSHAFGDVETKAIKTSGSMWMVPGSQWCKVEPVGNRRQHQSLVRRPAAASRQTDSAEIGPHPAADGDRAVRWSRWAAARFFCISMASFISAGEPVVAIFGLGGHGEVSFGGYDVEGEVVVLILKIVLRIALRELVL